MCGEVEGERFGEELSEFAFERGRRGSGRRCGNSVPGTLVACLRNIFISRLFRSGAVSIRLYIRFTIESLDDGNERDAETRREGFP